jgi:MSHA biogenesis protein MshM
MIYLPHFGLREPPFGITPDTSFFYACASSQEALNTLVVAIVNGEGFIKITGDIGTGKTLLCRKFLATLNEGWVTAYIPNPNLEPRALLLALSEELGARLESGLDQHRLIKALNLSLLDIARSRKRTVVCLDEAQAMPLETLETLRLLTNLETEKRKLVQVVLFGQPELDAKLERSSIRQLRQRITFQHRLGTLTRSETRDYLSHRVRVAGYQGDEMFSPFAVKAIQRASRGVPRLVNILANKAMMAAYGDGSPRVRRRHALAAISDTPASFGLATAWLWLVLGCVAFSSIGWVLLG